MRCCSKPKARVDEFFLEVFWLLQNTVSDRVEQRIYTYVRNFMLESFFPSISGSMGNSNG